MAKNVLSHSTKLEKTFQYFFSRLEYDIYECIIYNNHLLIYVNIQDKCMHLDNLSLYIV